MFACMQTGSFGKYFSHFRVRGGKANDSTDFWALAVEPFDGDGDIGRVDTDRCKAMAIGLITEFENVLSSGCWREQRMVDQGCEIDFCG